MKYYAIGLMVLVVSSGILALWGIVDIRWFFTVAASGLVLHFTLDMLGGRINDYWD